MNALKRIFKLLLALARVINIILWLTLLFVLTGYVTLHSRAGRDWLTRQVDQQTSGQVRIQDLGGLFPLWWRAGSVELYDHAAKPWLTLQDVELRLSLRTLLEQRLHLPSAHVHEARLHRLPDYADDEPSRTKPIILRALNAPALTLDHAIINPGIAGFAINGDNLQATFSWVPAERRYDITAQGELHADQQPSVTAACTITRPNGSSPWRISLHADAPRLVFGDEELTGLKLLANAKVGGPPGQPRLIIDLDTLSGRARGMPFAVLEPARYTRNEADGLLDLPRIDLNGMELQATVHTLSNRLEAVHAKVPLLDLQAWPIFSGRGFSGHVSTKVELDGLSTSPTGHIVISSSSLGIATGPGRLFDQARLELTADLSPDAITARLEIQHPRIETLRLHANAGLVHRDGFLPLAAASPPRLETRIELAIDLPTITSDLLNAPVTLGGTVMSDLTIKPSGETYGLEGFIIWTNGQFRQITTGTFIDGIHMHLVGEDRGLRIMTGTAHDGGGGRMNAGGRVMIDPTNGLAWSAGLDLEQATLFRLIRTDLPLSGHITATGDNVQAGITGTLFLEPFRFNIPRRLPPSIPQLDVIEVNHPDPARNTGIQQRPANAPSIPLRPRYPVAFDLAVRTRNTFEVAGRGLQSEWRGKMNLTGTTATPRLTGAAEVTRGHALLLGRRFTIDEGRIDLTGDLPPRPLLNLMASTRVGGILARLVVSGTTERPSIRLTSDPLLPEDEIMAMVLFGKMVDTMTPWQAVALANGLRILSGGNDIVSVMSAGQNLLHVDQIDIKQDEEGEGFASVTLGKHIGSNVYLEGEKGFGSAEDVVTIKLELSPHLLLETETSPRIREGIGLYWRRDM